MLGTAGTSVFAGNGMKAVGQPTILKINSAFSAMYAEPKSLNAFEPMSL